MKEITQIDIIILSYAQTEDLKQTTINCINSLMESEDPAEIQFNIIIVESNHELNPYQYDYGRTIYPDQPFGYHRYMNMGINMTASSYVCLCNNDLIFHANWATEILKPFKQYLDVFSASPICSIHHPKMGYKLNDGLRLGFRVREELAGWCIFMRRDVFKFIGQLDENYIFWCADNDYANTLWLMKLNHVLVTSSIVDHLENKTLNSQSAERREELTDKEVVYFDKKWKYRRGEDWTEL